MRLWRTAAFWRFFFGPCACSDSALLLGEFSQRRLTPHEAKLPSMPQFITFMSQFALFGKAQPRSGLIGVFEKVENVSVQICGDGN